jgi:hypothetical protein
MLRHTESLENGSFARGVRTSDVLMEPWGKGRAKCLESHNASSLASRKEGNSMGDKGGKKDKQKSQQQLAKKHQQQEQRKQDRVPARTALAAQR